MNEQDRASRRKAAVRRRQRKSIAVIVIVLFGVYMLGFLCGWMIHGPEENSGKASDPIGSEETEKIPLVTDNITEETTPSTSETYKPIDDWRLTLVNPWNKMDFSNEIELTELKNGKSVDARCYPELQEMMDACRAAGLSPVICSAYRSLEYQENLFQAKIDDLIADGYSQAEAEEGASKIVAVPGTSEHHLGLAVDIVDESYQLLDSGQEDTPVQKWLLKNSWKYGFILRYPSEKSGITGIIYEPWHYRYVGKEAAKEIYESGVCLEEYLETVQK